MTPSKAKFYFQILTSSGVPIYRQIIHQVKTLIATGKLEQGVFLPSIRQVAEEMEINPMTVSKAYSLLEKEGVLEFVRGQGMAVKGSNSSKKNLKERQDAMTPLLKEVITKASQLSLDSNNIIKQLKILWEDTNNE